ncbi:Nitroreductase-like protein [Mycena alexandri]|uniref:Nitroreductase-like protein n=1 Tax=Mycena alexandri TaxID=1745969 RepID=A0AAD6TKT2_9AGAR|nr:Nitroreductase-like protein [Mycena alexandri]
MSDAYLKAAATRRTNYVLANKSSVPDNKIEAIVQACVLHNPSTFNTQSGRAVIVTGAAHAKLWKLVSESQLKTLEQGPRRTLVESRLKAFAGAYGSIMFFEDQAVIDAITVKMPMFTKQFPTWSSNSAGMLQVAVWTALSAEGLGASLQHNGAYSDELVADIHKTFSLPTTWTSTAIMPFGDPAAPPAEKTFGPIEERVKFIKE